MTRHEPSPTGHRNRPHAFQGRHSRYYDFVARRLFRRMYRRFAEDVAGTAPDGGAVLDVGTGPGVLLVELARLRPDLELSGVDLSTDMVAAAARNLATFGQRASARHGDVGDLPFPANSFDVVVSSLSLHHWDPQAAGPELARVLRPGGKVCIYDLPFAPFDELTAALPGNPQPRRTPIRTGTPLGRQIIRYVVPIQAP